MTLIQRISMYKMVVVDASVAVAIAAREAGSEQIANIEMAALTGQGCEFFAPGVLLSESLYVLCKKRENGILSQAAYNQATLDLDTFLSFIQPSPTGDFGLSTRASVIHGAYSCRRSADAIYIALADSMSALSPTVLLTFDKEMPKQAAATAPSVVVQVL